MSSSDRAKVLNAKLPDPSFRLDETLTNAVADRLRTSGYDVTILKDVRRRAGSPDRLEQDLSEIATTSDAVLHLYFEDVVVESPRRTTDYLPRISVSAATFVRQNKSYPYYPTVYYGVDATEPKEYYIPQDPKHVYADFDAIVNNLVTMRTHFQAGTSTVGVRVADRVHNALK